MEISSTEYGNERVLTDYKLGKTLSSGLFGKVKIAEHVLTGHKVAIKIFNRKKIEKTGMEEKVKREIKILGSFMHPHIIRFYEVIETPTDIFVVMEYANSGELFDYIVEKGRLQEDEARHFFQQIISAVEYCHRNMVVHRDLCPESILLDSNRNVKVTDFGFSNIMCDGHLLKTSCGRPNYAAPEVISGKPYAGPEVDVWSCGATLYALLCGTLPFDDENIPNLFRKIKGGIYTLPNDLSALARDLITRMLLVDPMRRITVHEIREHPWFQASLPHHLAVPLTHTMQEAKKIDEDILREVVNEMGFNLNELIDSLHSRVQNKGTVAYYLLLDNQFHANARNLGAEFQETVETGLSQNNPEGAPTSTIAHPLPGDMEHQGVVSPHFPVKGKWALGLQSCAHPREIITEFLGALQELNLWWKMIGRYNTKHRWEPGYDGYKSHSVDIVKNPMHANHGFGDQPVIVEIDDANGKTANVFGAGEPMSLVTGPMLLKSRLLRSIGGDRGRRITLMGALVTSLIVLYLILCDSWSIFRCGLQYSDITRYLQ